MDDAKRQRPQAIPFPIKHINAKKGRFDRAPST
jgi:hypothetical protein